MADGKKNDAETELELDSSGKSKKKMFIIIAVVVVVVVLLGGIGGYFLFMGGDSSADQAKMDAALNSDSGDGTTATVSADSGAQLGSALYVPMPRPFRFNVPGAVRDRFVEIRVQLLVRGSDNEENSKMHIPLIESTLLGVFSQANSDDLATSAGKTSLKQKALVAVQQIMTDIEGDKTVEKILFTGFVMQ
jgi:flagellar FliL protein